MNNKNFLHILLLLVISDLLRMKQCIVKKRSRRTGYGLSRSLFCSDSGDRNIWTRAAFLMDKRTKASKLHDINNPQNIMIFYHSAILFWLQFSIVFFLFCFVSFFIDECWIKGLHKVMYWSSNDATSFITIQ